MEKFAAAAKDLRSFDGLDETQMASEDAKRGTRQIDRATVVALAKAAGLELSEDRIAVMLELLSSHNDFLNQVDRELNLSFQFDDMLHYVHPAHGFRIKP